MCVCVCVVCLRLYVCAVWCDCSSTGWGGGGGGSGERARSLSRVTVQFCSRMRVPRCHRQDQTFSLMQLLVASFCNQLCSIDM